MDTIYGTSLLVLAIMSTLVIHSSEAGQVCAACSDILRPDDCQHHLRCGDDEECYIRRFVNESGTNLYELGCSATQACYYSSRPIIGKRTSGKHFKCLSCCNNTALCNQFSDCILPKDSPAMCASCSRMSSPADCQNKVQCEKDEKCYIHKYSTEAGSTLYDLGCITAQACPPHPSARSVKQRAVYHLKCMACCTNDMCNRNLTCRGSTTTIQTTTTTQTSTTASECPVLTLVASTGTLSTSERYEGITVNVTCKASYVIVGASKTTCNSGAWSNTLGSCEKECAMLVPDAAGTFNTVEHYEGITVQLTCYSGYTLVGASTITCNSGSWNNTLGSCKKECPMLVLDATGTFNTVEHYEGITVQLTCYSGYTLVGASTSTCNSGSWNNTLGSCKKANPRDCSEVGNTFRNNGSYRIYPDGFSAVGVIVYCEFNSDGAWTVIHRRVDGSVDFYRNWTDYRNGFGDVNGNVWIGNDAIHYLTTQGNHRLKIRLTDWSKITKYALYSTFRVAEESHGYRLTLSGYSGNAGDHFDGNTYQFSTRDVDHDTWSDGNCATLRHGGWWYWYCTTANLNGAYMPSSHDPNGTGIFWWGSWHSMQYSYNAVTMLIQR